MTRTSNESEETLGTPKTEKVPYAAEGAERNAPNPFEDLTVSKTTMTMQIRVSGSQLTVNIQYAKPNTFGSIARKTLESSIVKGRGNGTSDHQLLARSSDGDDGERDAFVDLNFGDNDSAVNGLSKSSITSLKTTGWLHKKGGSRGGRHNWLRRFFKVEGSVALYFESEKEGERPKGMIELRDAIIV